MITDSITLTPAIYGGLWFGPGYVSRLRPCAPMSHRSRAHFNSSQPALYDSGLFFRSALILPVSAGDLGLTTSQSRFAFYIETTSIDLASSSVRSIDRTPWMYYDVQSPRSTSACWAAWPPWCVMSPSRGASRPGWASAYTHSRRADPASSQCNRRPGITRAALTIACPSTCTCPSSVARE